MPIIDPPSSELKTLANVIESKATRSPDSPCFGQIINQTLNSLNNAQVLTKSCNIINWLIGQGIANDQDTRISFLSNNCLNTRLFYNALLLTRMIAVPVYLSLGKENIIKVINKSNCIFFY